MANAKFKKPFAVKGIMVTSPKGKAFWCKHVEPDRVYNPDGALSTNLVCDPNEPTVVAFIEKLEALRDTALEETKANLGDKAKAYTGRDVYTMEYDKEGMETGNIVFKFTLKDIDKRKAADRQHTIDVLDAKTNRIDKPPLVGNGSIIRCAAYANPYNNPNQKQIGISLIWSKMQIIQLEQYNGGGGSDFEEEDGYVAEKKPPVSEGFAVEEDDELDF